MQNPSASKSTSWHFDGDTTELAQSIAHVLSVQNTPVEAAAIFLDKRLEFHDLRPAATYDDSDSEIYGACWHRGTHYDYLLVGDPAHVAQYCDLTAGERELIILTGRRLGSTNEKVYAVASGTYKKLHPTLQDLHGIERLTMRGLVAARG